MVLMNGRGGNWAWRTRNLCSYFQCRRPILSHLLSVSIRRTQYELAPIRNKGYLVYRWKFHWRDLVGALVVTRWQTYIFTVTYVLLTSSTGFTLARELGCRCQLSVSSRREIPSTSVDMVLDVSWCVNIVYANAKVSLRIARVVPTGTLLNAYAVHVSDRNRKPIYSLIVEANLELD